MESIIMMGGLLSGLVSLIALIVFFVMSSNVAKIRSILADKPTPRDQYYKHMFYGDQDKAREALKERFWMEVKNLRGMYVTTDERLKAYENKKITYSEDFKALGLTFPDWNGGDTW